MNDVLLTLVSPYLPPASRKRMLMASTLFYKSRAFVDKLTREWIDRSVNERVMWKYNVDHFVFDMTRNRGAISNGAHSFDIPENYEVRHMCSVANNNQWIVLIEPLDRSKPFIGVLVDNSAPSMRNLAHFEFRFDTLNKETIEFHYAFIQNNVLSVCHSALLVSRSRKRRTYATEFHLNRWSIDATVPSNPILHRLPHKILRGLFSTIKPSCVGLVDGRIYNQQSVMFDYYHTPAAICMAITETKQSALLMDPDTPSYFEIDPISDIVDEQETCSRFKVGKINVVQTSPLLFAVIVPLEVTFKHKDIEKDYTRETWAVAYEYNRFTKVPTFKNKLLLCNGVMSLGTYHAFFENDIVILTVGFSSDEYKQYSYESDGETSYLRPLAITVVNKSLKTELL